MTARADATSPSPAGALSARGGLFVLQMAAWSVGLFGLARLPWVESHVVGALISFQSVIAAWYAGPPRSPLVVTPSCSGTDAAALCIAVLLAYPLPWRRRLVGALGATALVLATNAVRLVTLFRASSFETLNTLHVWVWPVVLTVVLLAYVVWWIARDPAAHAFVGGASVRTFAGTAAIGLVGYGAAVPWAFTSATFAQLSTWTAQWGAHTLTALGLPASAVGPTLTTARGAFVVTPECLFTPVIPLAIAALVAVPMGRSRRLAAFALLPVVFFALGTARLFALALPASLADHPMYLVHGFYEIVLAVVAIVLAAHVSRPTRTTGRGASGRAAWALSAGLATVIFLGAFWETGVLGLARAVALVVPATATALVRPGEEQGALALLPVVQLGLVAALWVALTGGARVGKGLLALGLLALAEVGALVLVGLAAHAGLLLHAVLVRGFTVAVPLGLAGWLFQARGTSAGWTHRATATAAHERATYRQFWASVGEEFPDLGGAPSTALYRSNEQAILRLALAPDARADEQAVAPGARAGLFAGRTVLKTDLWDEAKNTRILQWVAAEGARVYGIDISPPTVRQAQAGFPVSTALRPAIADVRRLPFADGSFDAVYSMGTIEHFAETEATVHELARVLRPGGRLILGVPNRHDPFLRPAFVWALSQFGAYAYGEEKSYSRRALRGMIEQTGLEVRTETGLLFIPGWLRMFDLWCHTACRPLQPLARLLVAPFVWLDRTVPAVRRHGYLLATVAVKRTAPVLAVGSGVEYVIDAHGCDPARLRSVVRFQDLFADLGRELGLRTVGDPLWHVFPGAAGLTGVVLLAESHLAVHTYPETGLATLNLYCCRPRAEWAWERELGARLGAARVVVRRIPRG